MKWTRAETVPYPLVWHRFQGRRPMPDGTVPEFRVQDLPPDRFDDAVAFMLKEFFMNEPCCKSLDLGNDSSAIEQMKDIWYELLEERLTVVCFREDPSYPDGICPEIVGMNVLNVGRKEDKGKVPKMYGNFSHVLGAVLHCMALINVFDTYGVNEYLSATGLSVSKKYLGQNIGAEILRARIPLCKAVGLKVSATAFTAIESQVLAKKVGFEDVAEISYEDLRKLGYAIGDMPTTKAMKLMVLRVD